MADFGDLYVVDTEFQDRGKELANHQEFFSEILTEYLAIMDYLCGSFEGESAEELRRVVDDIRPSHERLLTVSGFHQGDCDRFVTAIDKADSYVY